MQLFLPIFLIFFFFNDTATTEIYTFPYTTLFRSICTGVELHHPAVETAFVELPVDCAIRSEEHTSALQSPDHIVCRLLLEQQKQAEGPRSLLHARAHRQVSRRRREHS